MNVTELKYNENTKLYGFSLYSKNKHSIEIIRKFLENC